MKSLNRRQFLRLSCLSAASFGVLPSLRVNAAAQAGANDEIRYAVVGFNERGRSHIEGMRKVKGTRLIALCDVDRSVLDRELKNAEKRGEKVEGYTDIRKLLENKDLDAVTFATPNHWHSLGAIWAVQAGKDVYVEKPVSHNVWEGRKLVEAARKHERIVQVGTQIRSSNGVQEGMDWLHAGNIGKILRSRGLCYKRRASIGKVDGPQPIPASIDYDLWCGPAAKEPLMRKRLHYDWHWVWNTGNGDLGNQGIHQMDIARWALGVSELSPGITSFGGRLGYVDDGQTPNTLVVFHDYRPAPLIFEVRGLPAGADSEKMDEYRGAKIGVVVDCEGGSMVVPSYSSAIFFDKSGKEVKKFSGDSSHFENFIKAVRSRNHADLHADVLEGHLSSALCHTGNISYRLGKGRPPEEIREQLQGNKDAAESFGRMEEHLAANKVDLKKTPATLGAALQMNPHTEKFAGNAAADRLLRRDYRKPFVVPEVV